MKLGWREEKTALAGNRTRVNCLEGSYAHHYTTNATWKVFPNPSHECSVGDAPSASASWCFVCDRETSLPQDTPRLWSPMRGAPALSPPSVSPQRLFGEEGRGRPLARHPPGVGRTYRRQGAGKRSLHRLGCAEAGGNRKGLGGGFTFPAWRRSSGTILFYVKL